MRFTMSARVAWWRGAALLALVVGLLPALAGNEAAGRSEAVDGITAAGDGDGDVERFTRDAAPGWGRLRLVSPPPGWICDATALPAASRQGGGAGGEKVTIRHPRANKDVPPLFVAAVQVAANKKDVTKNKVTPTLVDKAGNTLKDAVRVLKVVGAGEKAKSSRLFLLVKAPKPGTNPHKLKVSVKLPDNTYHAEQMFNIKVPNNLDLKIIDLTYPPDNYPIEGGERDYFLACGPSSSYIDDDNAKIGDVKGIPHWNNDNQNEAFFWVEFVGLGTIPGPGQYDLRVTNAEGESITRPVSVEDG